MKTAALVLAPLALLEVLMFSCQRLEDLTISEIARLRSARTDLLGDAQSSPVSLSYSLSHMPARKKSMPAKAICFLATCLATVLMKTSVFAADTTEAACHSLNGVYEYFPTQRTDTKNSVRSYRAGFNDVLGRGAAVGNLEGVRLTHGPAELKIEILGSNLKTAALPPEKLLRYDLSINCEQGLWVSRSIVSGSSDGTPVHSEREFRLTKDGDHLSIRSLVRGHARYLGIFKRDFEGDETYVFRLRKL